MNDFFSHLINITLEMAPWLLFGLLTAGLIKAWVPESRITRLLGGSGMGAITRGALIGAPLPLCSCSVIPMAMGLRRNGASNPATVAFLVSTPETGIDSIALTWSLLGPLMTVARPVCAILSGIFAGFLTLLTERGMPQPAPIPPTPRASACGGGCGCAPSATSRAEPATFWQRTQAGIDYALRDLWDDIAPWLVGGVVITAAVTTWIPYGNLSGYTQNSWLAMILVVLASMPIYVCATASTPMAAAMIFSGMTPGMALAFMLAGPATNLAPLAILRRELGSRVLTAYLAGVFISAVGLGMVTDQLAQWMNWMPEVRPGEMEEWLPAWFSTVCTLLLAGVYARNQWRGRRARSPVRFEKRSGVREGCS
ncbi:MAG: SO_0444 family Cu/Zn efflux transporter [Magnetococcales bacterium]|nr:SO_0444 family Cu/Zn efflux transporter [Magnetococcales bacterium]